MTNNSNKLVMSRKVVRIAINKLYINLSEVKCSSIINYNAPVMRHEELLKYGHYNKS